MENDAVGDDHRAAPEISLSVDPARLHVRFSEGKARPPPFGSRLKIETDQVGAVDQGNGLTVGARFRAGSSFAGLLLPCIARQRT